MTNTQIPLRPPALSGALQLLLVVAAGWGARDAQLMCFQRADAVARWAPAGSPLAVTLGRSGLAPGGALPQGLAAPPMKREGDGCSPAGVFPLAALFGNSEPPGGAKLPWLQATPGLKCIDDPTSRHYNRIVDQDRVDSVDWASCEDMLRTDRRYELGAVVGCNCDPVLPGAGSCIFLHVWEREGAPTAGCTAMALADMTRIAGWLDGARSPLLVQLPRAAYERLRGPWGLPDFPT
jgi:L,D-peptidoglycan transpeptidase YkuD (ErfK/YbiS/YcfS/YnhG family)